VVVKSKIVVDEKNVEYILFIPDTDYSASALTAKPEDHRLLLIIKR
jgi:hypothetical protein